MSENNIESIGLKHRDPLEDAAAIKRCLDYLRIEAERTGLPFAAHLIGVAAEAVSDSIALSENSVARINRDGSAQIVASAEAEVDTPNRRH
ncbi:MAG: hypothetical protein RH942_12770 [Kiloniellaceae bacterium]